jgi:hypothetical protein
MANGELQASLKYVLSLPGWKLTLDALFDLQSIQVVYHSPAVVYVADSTRTSNQSTDSFS